MSLLKIITALAAIAAIGTFLSLLKKAKKPEPNPKARGLCGRLLDQPDARARIIQQAESVEPDSITDLLTGGEGFTIAVFPADKAPPETPVYLRPPLNPDASELVEALRKINQYGADTLSGNAEGKSDRKWYRSGVVHMTNTALTALANWESRDE